MEQILSGIAQSFDLGKIISHVNITEGVLNQNYLLETDKGKYFIKSIRGKVSERVNYIAKVERFMKTEGIPALCMLQTTDGTNFFEHEGVRYSVYSYVESDRSHSYTSADYRTIGEMLAKIHQASFGKNIDAIKEKELWGRRDDEIIQKLKDYKTHIEQKDMDSIDKEFLEYINLKLSLAEQWHKVPDMANDTLIHGDYHAGNLLIDKDSRELIGVCDWEKAEYAPRMYELARAVLYIAFDKDVSDMETSLQIVKAFVEGYKNILSVVKDEFENGLKMRLTRHVITSWIENMHYGEGNSRANHFVKNEMRILKDFVQGDGITKLTELIS